MKRCCGHRIFCALTENKSSRLGGTLMEDNLIPKHIAIIMDGNGRWANKRGLPRTAGHAEGALRVREIVEACARLGCDNLTIYAFSTKNWKRPKDEVDTLMKYFIKYVGSEKKRLIKNGIRTRIIGEKSQLPPDVLSAMEELERVTANGERMCLNIALNYGSKAEIIRAVQLCARDAVNGLDVEKIDEEVFRSHLFTDNTPDPDLLIRTAGEQRLSNFLLYQLAYTEFYFTPVYWPDFNTKCLNEAVEEYRRRTRRFGGLK
jgi:undecaprenyl diphosphate synthase